MLNQEVGRQTDFDIITERFTIDGLTKSPSDGTIVLIAPDSSKLSVSVSDTPGLLNLSLQDKSGDQVSDIVSWDTIYIPNE